MNPKNAFYAQSGGPTAVINTSASAVIETAHQYREQIGKVLAGRNGIMGALQEELIDTSLESPEAIRALCHTPGSAFGSCRYKLKNFEQDDTQYRRLIDVFQAHDIGYFFYNGGNDSQDTANKVSQMSQTMGYPLTCIGIPKTIDNDLPHTDTCPGFGSAAKYVAISTLEAALDIKGMAASSTKVFVLEVMGRHAGWLAAATGLASNEAGGPPHIILFPEIPLDLNAFLDKVKHCVTEHGYCVIAVSEGIRHTDGRYITESNSVDAFGHEQLGGAAPVIAHLVKKHLGYKFHWAVADYLQRSARHIASQTDAEQAYALGKAAVEYALAGKSDVMLTINRESDAPYTWSIGTAPLNQVANVERKMPRDFISKDGFGITPACRNYLAPLIEGEAYPPYEKGMPTYSRLRNGLIEKKLNVPFSIAD